VDKEDVARVFIGAFSEMLKQAEDEWVKTTPPVSLNGLARQVWLERAKSLQPVVTALEGVRKISALNQVKDLYGLNSLSIP
ncbi:MAG: hypothetical protein ACP5NQ_09530, partial [Vulcanisaeta sp.]